jgi:PleD family two-component response regulator
MPDPAAPTADATTASREPGHPRLALLADAQEWPARSLASILAPSGYVVHQVYSGPQLLAAAHARPADVILLKETLRETDVLELVRQLRQDAVVADATPIVLIAAGHMSRPRLVAALRAGATDMWNLPMDSEELVLRLEALVRAKLAAERAREEGLLDAATGFYNRHGLTVRARELASQADRRRGALACVVLGVPWGVGASEDAAELDAALEAVTTGLRQAGRSSDAIGRLGLTEFAVIAPDADAPGARQLGTRLGRAVERASAAAHPKRPLQLRAGYHAVGDFHQAGLGPLDVLARATTALRAAEAGADGSWIRAFESGPRE